MYEYNATATRVIDGDTIEVAVDLGFRITQVMPLRLYGINAPETNSMDEKERKNGKSAKDWLSDTILEKQVRIRSAKPKDKYGRFLAEVWLISGVQARSVNEEMVALGLAKVWDGSGIKPV